MQSFKTISEKAGDASEFNNAYKSEKITQTRIQ